MSIHVAESIIPSIATDCRTFWPRRLSSINCQLRTKLTRPMRQLVGTGLVCSNNLASPTLPPHPLCPSHHTPCAPPTSVPAPDSWLPPAQWGDGYPLPGGSSRPSAAGQGLRWPSPGCHEGTGGGPVTTTSQEQQKSTTTTSQQQQQVNKYTQQQHKNKSINSVTVLYVYNRKHWLYRCKYTTSYVCVSVCMHVHCVFGRQTSVQEPSQLK